MSLNSFGGLVKAVVDIKKELMVVGADMHADEEKFLLENGSKQDNLWGINLYPAGEGEDFIEFDSMINIRPRINNFTRSIDNPEIRKKITATVNKLVTK
ncbi:hypothetical protein HYT02_05650 [Candidatus Gottesmanbacteria bacterium]|nr:hypothetical protein [Candidatus Gottesmanbacteria bacterium]